MISLGLETRVRGTEISEKMTAANWSYLTITFDPVVTLEKSSFPPWTWSTYLAVLGGTAGLWLGLGIMQLIEILCRRLQPKQRIISIRRTGVIGKNVNYFIIKILFS